jgi:membrane-associated phospholipid phosphatase
VRSPRAIRAAAWAVVAVGVAAPLVRRRARVPAPAVLGLAAAAPLALSVARPRTPARDAGIVMLQMWAYLAAYEMPNDDPERLARRVHVGYPIEVDRVLGLGTLPGLRLQRAFSRPGSWRPYEKVLVWAHWVWFFVPHGTMAYVLLRHHERFERSALRMYAVFDVGVTFYWTIPTAPPWYAAAQGRLEDGRTPTIRRMMLEYGEVFWRDRWGGLYDALAGNPLAAMPSLHFATSVMAAVLLSEIGPAHGAVGWSYALTLGVALVYLGEHYVADLLAGLALAEAVRRAEAPARPWLGAVSRRLQALEARARG